MEVFKAKEALRRIRTGPKEERAGKLAEVKERLAEQIEGLAQLQAHLIARIRENPDAVLGDLIAELQRGGAKLGMNKEQEEIATDAIDEYARKHRAVHSIRLQYSDDRALYRRLFRREPHGDVVILEGPMTLYVRCFNLEDYALIYSGKFKSGSELDANDIAVASEALACHINASAVPGLEGTITAENFAQLIHDIPTARERGLASKRLRTHEEQHAIKRLFESGMLRYAARMEAGGARFDSLLRFRAYLRDMRQRDADDRARDEILAYFKMGRAEKDMADLLLRKKGMYDYLDGYLKLGGSHFETIRGGADWARREESSEERDSWNSISILGVARTIFIDEYREVVKGGIDACFRLREAGWSDEKVIGALIHEPLVRWKKVVDRVLPARTT